MRPQSSPLYRIKTRSEGMIGPQAAQAPLISFISYRAPSPPKPHTGVHIKELSTKSHPQTARWKKESVRVLDRRVVEANRRYGHRRNHVSGARVENIFHPKNRFSVLNIPANAVTVRSGPHAVSAATARPAITRFIMTFFRKRFSRLSADSSLWICARRAARSSDLPLSACATFARSAPTTWNRHGEE
jgi:hypothetical protein